MKMNIYVVTNENEKKNFFALSNELNNVIEFQRIYDGLKPWNVWNEKVREMRNQASNRVQYQRKRMKSSNIL